MKNIQLFLLLCCSSVFAQQIGQVKDGSGKPIPYVSIWLEGSGTGTTSDEEGKFTINTGGDSTLIFSALGFETKKVAAKDAKLVVLREKPMEIEEVVISARKKVKELEIGGSKKKRNFQWINTPSAMAKYFEYKPEYSATPYIKNAIVYTFSEKDSASFKLRIYKMGSDDLPGDDLVRDNIIVWAKKGLQETIVDLTGYNLDMPSEGIVIGYEPILTEKNLNVYKTGGINYNPALIWNNVERAITYEFNEGEWNKTVARPYDKDINEPAINLTLTN